MAKEASSLALLSPALGALQRLRGSLLASMVEDEFDDFRGADCVEWFVMGAVGATLILWTFSAGLEAVIIGAMGACGATETLFRRDRAAGAGPSCMAPELSYFLSVSTRNCLDSAARALYSLHLRRPSKAAITSGVIWVEISGRVSLACKASGENVALNIRLLQGRN